MPAAAGREHALVLSTTHRSQWRWETVGLGIHG